ncbi:hypothetical protein ABRP72_19870 [Pectobacterium carotovorum]
MNRNMFWMLLLLPAFPVLSDSLITCEPEKTSDKMVIFFILLTIISLFFLIFINLYWFGDNDKFEPFTRRTPFIIIANFGLIYVAVLIFNYIRDMPTDLKPVFDKETILSSPEVVRGARYKSECIIISQNAYTVELSCKPDAAIESVSRKEFASALDALSKANEYIDDLSYQIRQTNICKPKN